MDLKGIYTADANRYGDAEALYKRCGKSGVLLPKVSLGFWHNFGGVDPYERSRAITHYAPRNHPLRPRQQLWPSIRKRRGNHGQTDEG